MTTVPAVSTASSVATAALSRRPGSTDCCKQRPTISSCFSDSVCRLGSSRSIWVGSCSTSRIGPATGSSSRTRPDEFRIRDTYGRFLTLATGDGVVQAVTDQADRRWGFVYDDQRRLVQVDRPATRGFAEGTTVTYGYDDTHRLVSITNARGTTWLENRYDDDGRVGEQRHGAGHYRFTYEQAGQLPVLRTRCLQKNGGLLEIEHDEDGHARARTLHVRRTAFLPEDIAPVVGDFIPVVTHCEYNGNGELTHRRLPGGRETRWTYSDAEGDARSRGNLVEIVELPTAGADTPYQELVTRFEFEPRFQQVTSKTDAGGATTSYEYDSRGNLVVATYPVVAVQPVGDQLGNALSVERVLRSRYAYNPAGQLVEFTDVGGSVTDYEYYPAHVPLGVVRRKEHHAARSEAGGYLARVVRDAGGARVTTGYGYDRAGHLAETVDGKGHATRVHCDALGRIETVVGRDSASRVDYNYDADSNPVESVQTFTRPVNDGETSSSLRELRVFDELGDVIERGIVGDDLAVTERLVRDEAGRVVRVIQPLGETTEYVYDERDLIIEKRVGVGASEGFAEPFSYDLDGAPRCHTDGDGNAVLHRYDSFQRYAGFTDPAGTTTEQSVDEVGNAARVAVADAEGRLLTEARYSYDSWRRVVRADRAWFAAEDGRPLGASSWDGREGVVSTITEYEDNGLPTKLWGETGNIVNVRYDGANRLSSISDSSGRALAFDYDENGNVRALTKSGRGDDGVVELAERLTYDPMDRVASRQWADGSTERFRRNELGALIGYVAPSGLEIKHTLDGLGRPSGHVYEVAGQRIARAYAYDASYRLQAYTDAAGNHTTYEYDALGRYGRRLSRRDVGPRGARRPWQRRPLGRPGRRGDDQWIRRGWASGHGARWQFGEKV